MASQTPHNQDAGIWCHEDCGEQAISTIATAVKEQPTNTAGISSNVKQASAGLDEVNHNLTKSAEATVRVAQEIARVKDETATIADNSRHVSAQADDLF